uniref:G-protein coupled receptors family 1 profile domain-containing protein n=1 Tax=Nomascus leucogenys TaxID=61853 RepID=A0A2I3GRA8_NOMLE
MYRFTDFDVSNISVYLNHVLFYTQQAGDLEHMETTNYSAMTEFFLMGLSQYPELQLFLFLLCLIIYTSSSIPPTLIIFMSETKSISFIGCALQMVVSLGLGSTECVLLATMACDCYVAICNPLRYSIIMNRVLYVQMAAWSWIIGCLTSLLQTVLTMILPFCGNNVIDHITCEILALLKLVCSDVTINVLIMTVMNIVLLEIPLQLIFISYMFILSSILRINSAEGRKEAFSTCSAHSAHLIVVILFYGSALFMYMKPKSKNTNTSDEIIGLSYGVVTLILNPIIYSLRNKEVKEAVKKHLHLLKM